MITTQRKRDRPADAPAALLEHAPDPHPWRATTLLGLLTVLVGMVYTLVVGPLIEHSTGWWIVPDAWVPLRAASYVANGAMGYLYESVNLFVATPLLPIVLAPAIFIEQHFRLVEGFPQAIPHPSMWLVYGPYGFALCIAIFHAARRISHQFGIDPGRPWPQVSMLVLVVFPAAIVWGHYEDVLAIAFVMLALCALVRGRSIPAALLFGVAVGFKQWALLGIPLLVAVCPASERRGVLASSLVPPGLLVAFPLAVDWFHASTALFKTRAFPTVGHRALWVAPSVRVIAGNPSRVGAFLVAFAVAWWLRGRTEHRLLLAGFAVVFLARLLFEPVLFSYYLCPALGLLVLHERLTHGSYRHTLLAGTCFLLFFAVHPPEVIWWAVALTLGTLLARPAVLDVWRREPLVAPNVRQDA